MIQLSTLLPAKAGPVRPALLASGSDGGFAVALGALVLPRALTGPMGDAVLPDRQPLAEPGKDLPVAGLETSTDSEAEEQDREDGADIAFAWFATAPIVQDTPPPERTPQVAPRARVAAATCEVDASLLPPAQAETPLEAVPTADPMQPPMPTFEVPDLRASVPAGEGTPSGPVTPISVPAGEAPLADQLVPGKLQLPKASAPPAGEALDTSAPAPRRPEAPSTRQLDAVAAPVDASSPPVTPSRAGPALPPFAPPLAQAALPTAPSLTPAVFPAALDIPRGARRTPVAADLAGIAIASSAPEALRAHVVAAAADVQDGTLDMRRQEWMGQMVEHIEAMRDASPTRETRLSLAPEALGKVDVSIRQDGDRIHVHFATETPAARQLIADAQPRLGELAEARGLKLGQTSFESGTAGQGANRDAREQPGPQQSLKPRPAFNPESSVGTADDDRIA